MENNLSPKVLQEMKKCVEIADMCIDKLSEGFYSECAVNNMLDVVTQHMETACIELRNIAEKNRPARKVLKPSSYRLFEEVYGEVEVLCKDRVKIKLAALLPHCRYTTGTQYVLDNISRLLNGFENNGGELPCFDKAFVAIIEHCNVSTATVFDSDNKGFKGVINALKGRLFKDDNQFELSLGLFNVIDDETYCEIYIMPFDGFSNFLFELEVNEG